MSDEAQWEVVELAISVSGHGSLHRKPGDPLPTIPVPLAGSDPDVPVDLQAIFTTVYDRAGYDYSLGYGRSVEPPLRDTDAAWVQRLLGESLPPVSGG